MYARANTLYHHGIHMNIQSTMFQSSFDPDVFGPPLWFTLHNAATSYSNQPTEVEKQRMKLLIENLIMLIPCASCKEHFYTFVSQSNLNRVVASRENLFNFFVHAHNYVNRRLQKPVMSLETAMNKYGFHSPHNGSTVRITYQ